MVLRSALGWYDVQAAEYPGLALSVHSEDKAAIH